MSRKAPEKPLPQNVEAEVGMVGSVLVSPNGWQESGKLQIGDQLMVVTPADIQARELYDHNLRTVWQRALDLRAEGKPVELILLIDELTRHGELEKVGGSAFVSALPNQVPTSQNAGQYAAIVREMWIRRGLIKSATGVVGAAYDTSASIIGPLAQHQNLLTQYTSLPSQEDDVPLPGVLMSEVEEEEIRWFWRYRLAHGKTSIIDGNGGMGKGLVSLTIAAAATRGDPLPGETTRHEPMNVLLISTEDNAADTIKPRLIAAKADMTRIRFLKEVPYVDPRTGEPSERSISIPRDVRIIERIVEQEHIGLLIIDPIMDCLDAGVKTSIDSEVRSATRDLRNMTERHGVITIMVRHFNKNESASAANRGGGSVAFINLARFGFIVVEHPDDAELPQIERRRVLSLAKQNFKPVDSLVFRVLADEKERAYIQWENAPCSLEANFLLSKHQTDERRILIQVLDEADAILTIDQIMERLPGDRRPSPVALRKRLSRLVSDGAITRVREGEYCSNAYAKTMSQQSVTSHQTHVSHVSQNGRYNGSLRVVTAVTGVTGWEDVTGDFDPPPADGCPTCGKHLWARRRSGYGWGCRVCDRQEVL